MSDLKLCKDCKHCKPRISNWFFIYKEVDYEFARCALTIDSVTGAPRAHCENERTHWFHKETCGPEAKNWEAQNEN